MLLLAKLAGCFHLLPSGTPTVLCVHLGTPTLFSLHFQSFRSWYLKKQCVSTSSGPNFSTQQDLGDTRDTGSASIFNTIQVIDAGSDNFHAVIQELNMMLLRHLSCDDNILNHAQDCFQASTGRLSSVLLNCLNCQSSQVRADHPGILDRALLSAKESFTQC